MVPFAKMKKTQAGLRREYMWWELMAEFCMRHVCGVRENPSRGTQQEIDNADLKLKRTV